MNSNNSNTANNLSTGWYYVNITDDVCTFIDSIFIDEPDRMEVSLSIEDVLCNGDSTGIVEVSSHIFLTPNL